VEQLRAEGYRIIAIEQIEGSTMLNDFRVEEGAKYALIFGNEVDGVDQAIADIVDGAIEIPQVGIKHSLNVSVSGGVVLWDFFCQIGLKR
jgi:tRNA G18 (ribose-2'-O)-methylase SpoU